MFCLELFAVRYVQVSAILCYLSDNPVCSVALVTLSADSLHTILPQYSANTYKAWGLLVYVSILSYNTYSSHLVPSLIPTVFMPLSLLSYTSILGISSTLFIVFVIFWDGLSKQSAPGSLWEPAPTTWLPGHAGELGISFGLFMAGFSGHTVIPSLARDMVDPSQFDKMIDWAFVSMHNVDLEDAC
jgi:vesicular inhibitory amino acid transporter